MSLSPLDPALWLAGGGTRKEDSLGSSPDRGRQEKRAALAFVLVVLCCAIWFQGSAVIAGTVGGAPTSNDTGGLKGLNIFWEHTKTAIPTLIAIMIAGLGWALGTDQGRGVMKEHGVKIIGFGILGSAATTAVLFSSTGSLL